MQFQFTFRHMDASPALQNYCEAKLKEKIEKFVTKPVEAHVMFSVVRQSQTAHVSLRGGDGYDLEVEETSSDMYATVDGLVDKLVAQMKKHKEKLKDHKVQRASKVVEEPSEELADAMDASEVLKFERGRKRASGAN
jgi:putative sigma-54 modulation protein